MLKALIPIDGSKTSERAVKHVIALMKGREAMEVHLVNVQESADAPEVKRFMKEADVKRMQLDHGAAALRGAKRMLERAGVEYKEHVLIGDPAEEITALAKRGRFDKIVMGTHGRGTLAGMLMGSVATKVLHRSSVPVTLVK
jgi:nucleotide-binding universal stress UspA family protein